MIERGYRFAEPQVFRAEDGAAGDRDAVVDDDAGVFGNVVSVSVISRRLRS